MTKTTNNKPTLTSVTIPKKCPIPTCNGMLSKSSDDPDVLTCLICSTQLDLRPLRRYGKRFEPEDRLRALTMAKRIGFAEAARILGISKTTLYAFRSRITPKKPSSNPEIIVPSSSPDIETAAKQSAKIGVAMDSETIKRKVYLELEIVISLIVKPQFNFKEIEND